MEVFTVDFLSEMKAKAKADKKVIVLPESYEIWKQLLNA